MYLGAGLALAGAALFYQSWGLLGYGAVFMLVVYLFVVVYEEPTLRATFGDAYVAGTASMCDDGGPGSIEES